MSTNRLKVVSDTKTHHQKRSVHFVHMISMETVYQRTEQMYVVWEETGLVTDQVDWKKSRCNDVSEALCPINNIILF